MANAQVPQGTLNRIRGSIVVPLYPELTVTAPYLGKDGVSLALEGSATDYHESMTGAVRSPAVYMMAVATVRLLKTQYLSDLYKAQMESDSYIGDITIIPDAATLGDYQLVNCSLTTVSDLPFGGTTAEMSVSIRGQYLVNSDAFAQ